MRLTILVKYRVFRKLIYKRVLLVHNLTFKVQDGLICTI